MTTVYELKQVPFPECATNCEVVKYLGVGECESVCPWKFNLKKEVIKNE